LIRNAVDHGIEPPHERALLGKPVHGTITISVLQLGHAVSVQVADDGRGIDPNKVSARAVEKGLINAEEAAHLSPTEALNLITTPGFSTASEVTSVSGRGVGMDIVRDAVLNLGGRLEITSEVGAGTTFSIVVPQSLAVLPCLIVRSGGTLWAIPTMHICETSLATDSPSVAERLGLPPDERPKFAFTISHPGASIRTLSVQSLLGEEPLVAKPMSALAGAHPAVQGAALLPNGEPILILDPLSL
jgi:two-component system chemotaxis sensor kinase CheA